MVLSGAPCVCLGLLEKGIGERYRKVVDCYQRSYFHWNKGILRGFIGFSSIISGCFCSSVPRVTMRIEDEEAGRI